MRTYQFALFLLPALLGAAPPAPSPATAPATQPAVAATQEQDDQTPLGLMRQYDRILSTGDIEMAKSYYLSTTAGAKQMVEAEVASDMSTALLELAARAKFGPEAADSLDKAMEVQTAAEAEAELKKAKVEIDGDHAMIKTPPDDGEEYLVRVNGKWKFDGDANVKDMPADVLAQVVKASKDQAQLTDRLAKEVAEGKFKTADELNKAAAAGTAAIPKEFSPGDGTDHRVLQWLLPSPPPTPPLGQP